MERKEYIDKVFLLLEFEMEHLMKEMEKSIEEVEE